MPIPIYGQIHAVSYLFPVTAGLARISRLNRAMRTLTVLSILACVNIALEYFLAVLLGNNLVLTHIYVVIECSLLCAVFYMSVPLATTRNTILMLGGSFVVFWIANIAFFFNPNEIDSTAQMVVRIVLIIMSAVTLQAVMRDESSSLVTRPVFWVAISVILYSAGTLIVVGLSNQLLALGIGYFDAAWDINWTFIIIANTCYAKGLLCKSQR
jgi:hypothetical protein